MKNVNDAGARDSSIKFQNYSRASKIRQAGVDPKIRRARAVLAAKTRWANKSAADRRAHALMMVAAKHSPNVEAPRAPMTPESHGKKTS